MLGVSTALYRRYRPETFAEVIGQEHVTDPLRQALKTGKVTHAYLFSGPRGCGKTSSARILARCLNCAEGPTDTPCGVCDSCVELARGGPGSLDVVEIDAASHNGVDDARDLRERAAFAPARDRYKIFILDEAHMVTAQGFNALLKIVEEPPPHIKFIFATTEPDKVIGTIRSRTHHYPFRLIAPDVLQPFLQEVCDSEGLTPASGVLPLVVRAGGGSARDTLSVLDQLAAGAVDGEVSYETAVALLGYTPSALLDDTVDALAARDGASVFRIVERVIGTGHEPRRFVEDLLERLRDLVVLSVAGEAGETTLNNLPADQRERMRIQAQHLGLAELSRAADIVNATLSEMIGATSPRLHLELMCARLLLPAADDGERGLAARIDRLERSGGAAAPVAAAPVTAPAPRQTTPVAPSLTTEPAAPASPATEAPRVAEKPEPAPEPVSTPEPEPAVQPKSVTEPVRAPEPEPVASPTPATPATPAAPEPSASQGAASVEVEVLRRRWPEVLDAISHLRKSTWALVSANAQVASLNGDVLGLSFGTAGLSSAFSNGAHAEVVASAVQRSLGFGIRVEAVSDGEPSTPSAPLGSGPTTWEPTARPEPVASPVAPPSDRKEVTPPEPDFADEVSELDEDVNSGPQGSRAAGSTGNGLRGIPLVEQILDAEVIEHIDESGQ